MIAPDLWTLEQPIGTLRLLPNNPRKGDVEAVMRSYEQFGQRKPVVALRDGTVIAGNHQVMAARKLGWQKIAVVYVDDDEKTAKAFALADNRVSDLGTYDDDLLAEMLQDIADDPILLEATSFSEDDLRRLLPATSDAGLGAYDDEGSPYTSVVNIPQYEIVGEKPPLSELYDDSKAKQLIDTVNRSDAPEDVKNFLTLAAHRHIVFNYRKIAEFYPHASKEIQALIEDSALVIIDYEDAIAKGFLALSEEIERLKEIDVDGKS